MNIEFREMMLRQRKKGEQVLPTDFKDMLQLVVNRMNINGI